jgi:hypothetical protein
VADPGRLDEGMSLLRKAVPNAAEASSMRMSTPTSPGRALLLKYEHG